MKKRRVYAYLPMLIWFAVPLIAIAAGLVPCGTGDSWQAATECQACNLVQLVQNVLKFLISISIPIAAILFAWGGFKYMYSGVRPAARAEANEIFRRTALGFVIILSAWLIVNTVLYFLVGQQYGGSWFTVQCVPNCAPNDTTSTGCRHVSGSLSNVLGQTLLTPTLNGGGAGGNVNYGQLTQCPPGNPSCSTAALQQAGYSAQQAAIMSCIAMTESSGNSNSVSNQPGSTACGTFQIVQSTWNKAASGQCSNFAYCTNAQCNAQTALALVQQSGYSSWTCPGCNAKAQACVNKYSI